MLMIDQIYKLLISIDKLMHPPLMGYYIQDASVSTAHIANATVSIANLANVTIPTANLANVASAAISNLTITQPPIMPSSNQMNYEKVSIFTRGDRNEFPALVDYEVFPDELKHLVNESFHYDYVKPKLFSKLIGRIPTNKIIDGRDINMVDIPFKMQPQIISSLTQRKLELL